tara:strand:+ start:231 stop:1553 length:1323 start_codon:yes stop_codon:yes gene_type:complete
MKKYFVYNGDYISGWRYWLRTFLQTFLIYVFGLGFYLWGVTSFTRAKSLGFSDQGAWAFAILLPVSWLVALAFAFSGLQIMVLIANIPHMYLWFKDGKKATIKSSKKNQKIKIPNSILDTNENSDSKFKSNIDDILTESSIPKTLQTEDSTNSTVKSEIRNFQNELSNLTNPDDDLYDYNYWYSFVQGRAKSMKSIKDQTDDEFVEDSAWSHADEYSKRLLNETETNKSNFVKPRIICYGKIYDLLKDLKNKIENNYHDLNMNEKYRLELIHAKASLFGAIKFAQKNNISDNQIKLWYPNFVDNVKNTELPFLKSLRKNFVGEDSNSKLFPIYDLSENQKNEIPFWFQKGLFIFGFFKQGKNFKSSSKSIKLNRLERSMFFHYQQFDMLLNKLPEFNKDGSYKFGNYEFFIETKEIMELIIQYFEENNESALELLNIKSQ